MSDTQETMNQPGAGDTADERGTPPPQAPAAAPAKHQAFDGDATRYAPTLVSLDAGAFIEDTCPMSYDVEDDKTYFYLGSANTVLSVAFSDRALLKIAVVANQAAQAMLRTRGKPLADWTNRECEDELAPAPQD